MHAKKLLISAALISTLTIGAGAALAQDDDTTPANPPAQQWGFRGPRNGPGMGGRQQGPMNRQGPGQGRFDGQGPMNGGLFNQGRGGMRQGIVSTLDLAEQYTGLTLSELRDAYQNDQTLADLIEANDQSVDAFIAAATETLNSRIDTAVENGRITEARAEELKAQILERATAMVNGELGPVHSLLEEYTGLNLAELQDAHQSGQTLAELIEANDQSVDAFIAAATDLANARIDTAVENGRITEARAEELKALALERITDMVNGELMGLRLGAI